MYSLSRTSRLFSQEATPFLYRSPSMRPFLHHINHLNGELVPSICYPSFFERLDTFSLPEPYSRDKVHVCTTAYHHIKLLLTRR